MGFNENTKEFQFYNKPEIILDWLQYYFDGANNMSITIKLTDMYGKDNINTVELTELRSHFDSRIKLFQSKREFLNKLGFDENGEFLHHIYNIVKTLLIDLPKKYKKNSELYSDSHYFYLVLKNFDNFINPCPYMLSESDDKILQLTNILEAYLKLSTMTITKIVGFNKRIQEFDLKFVDSKPIMKINSRKLFEEPYHVFQILINAGRVNDALILFESIMDIDDVRDVITICTKFVSISNISILKKL